MHQASPGTPSEHKRPVCRDFASCGGVPFTHVEADWTEKIRWWRSGEKVTIWAESTSVNHSGCDLFLF